MKTTITELVPTSSRKSFYGKAKLVDTGKTRFLRSYDTIAASVDQKGNVHRHTDWRSATTNAHVKSFMETCMDKPIATKAFWELPVEPYDPIEVTL